MTPILTNALLSIDAYNRGSAASIVFGNDPRISEAINGSTQIINQTVLRSQNSQEARTAGFYAIAYKDNVTGKITISYRGTDALLGGDGFGSDMWNGYGVGATSPLGKQAERSIRPHQSL
jgi:hypothetical protein